ncbi:hypothetical protein D3C78_1004240 [compost metagenome]
MHRRDHRHRVAVHGLEGGVVTGVDRDNPLGVRIEFLDVDPRAEAAPFGANDDHTDFRVSPQRLDVISQSLPLLAVQGVDRRVGDHQFSDPGIELGRKGRIHRVSPVFAR